MKILMFGWELAPLQRGGLGVASYGLTKYLSKLGVDILFVLPRKLNISSPFMKILFASEEKAIPYFSNPYLSPLLYSKTYEKVKPFHYSPTLFEEVELYAQKAAKIALSEDFDVIHAHDWLTIKAGIVAKKLTGKPLIFHVHATEYDRAGLGEGNHYVHEIEKQGLEEADAIIVVSNYTKNIIVNKYGIDEKKIFVVHNAVESNDFHEINDSIKQHYKVVLFLGRLTLQKGPDYFIRAAHEVLKHRNNILFVVAGTGDMEKQLINLAISLGIADKVVFTGFVPNDQVKKLYGIADVYVMPSVSEPFGISALEALASSTPVILSKQAGVSEVVNHCLKVDFWDVKEMANKIISILDNPPLYNELKKNGKREVSRITWTNSAKRIKSIYRSLI